MAEKVIEKKTEVKEETKKPEWVKLSSKEVEDLIAKLAKEGNSPAKIGLILRDQHGIPSVKAVIKKRLLSVLKEKGIKVPTEKQAIADRIEVLKAHFQKNKHDYPASRSLTKNLWALNRAVN